MGVPGQGATTSCGMHCAVVGGGCGPLCCNQQIFHLLFLLSYSWKLPVLCFNCDKIHITWSLLFHPLLNAQFSGIQLAMVCGMCPLLSGHHHHLSPEHFSSCRTETVYPWNINSAPPSHQPSAAIITLSVSVNLIFWGPCMSGIIQYMPFCDWLIYCSYLTVLRVYPCCSLCYNSIPSYGWIIFHCLYRLKFVFFSFLMDTWVVSTFWLLWIMLLWSGVYLSEIVQMLIIQFWFFVLYTQ